MFPFTRPLFKTNIKPEVKIYFQGKFKTSVILKTVGFNSEIEKKTLEGL